MRHLVRKIVQSIDVIGVHGDELRIQPECENVSLYTLLYKL